MFIVNLHADTDIVLCNEQDDGVGSSIGSSGNDQGIDIHDLRKLLLIQEGEDD